MTVPEACRRALLFGAAAWLCGCQTPSQIAGFRTAAVDPKSPVYQDVMNATRHPGPYPKFQDIPKTPTDIRPASAWAVAIADIKSDRAKVDSAVAALPPPATDAESFAVNARTQAQAPEAAAPPTEASAEAHDYAQSLKARATPPPKRRAHKR